MNTVLMCVLLAALIVSNLAAWLVVFSLNQKLLDADVRLGDIEFQATSRMAAMQKDLDFFSHAVLEVLKERDNEQKEAAI